MAMSADGSRVIVATKFGPNNSTVGAWEWKKNWHSMPIVGLPSIVQSREAVAVVAMSPDGTKMAIGSRSTPVNVAWPAYRKRWQPLAGEVRVFEWSVVRGEWHLVGTIVEDFVCDYLRMGLAMSDTHLVVGSPTTEGTVDLSISYKIARFWLGSGYGRARVFDLLDNSLSQVGPDLTGKSYSGGFGLSVDIDRSSSRIVVGGTRYSSGPYAKVYEWRNGQQWEQVGVNVDPVSPIHGYADRIAVAIESSSTNSIHVAITPIHSRDYMYIGSGEWHANEGYDNTSDFQHVHTKVFALSSNKNGQKEWPQVGEEIDHFDDDSVDDPDHMLFGGSMGLVEDGSRIVIGACSRDDREPTGHVRVFDWKNESTKEYGHQGRWQQVGCDMDGGVDGDEHLFGTRLSLSPDGNHLLVAYNKISENGHGASSHLRRYKRSD